MLICIVTSRVGVRNGVSLGGLEIGGSVAIVPSGLKVRLNRPLTPEFRNNCLMELSEVLILSFQEVLAAVS